MKLSNLEKQASSLGRRYYTLQLVFNLFKSLRASSIVQVGCQSRDSEYANFDLFQIFAELNEKKKKSTKVIPLSQNEREKGVNEMKAARLKYGAGSKEYKAAAKKYQNTPDFIQQYIFPGGVLPSKIQLETPFSFYYQ